MLAIVFSLSTWLALITGVFGQNVTTLINLPFTAAQITFDSSGNLFFTGNFNVNKLDTLGNLTIYAGSNIYGTTDGNATSARFNNPAGLVFDSAGNLFEVDTDYSRIRKITPAGAVTTFAGSGPNYADGNGTAALFNNPTGITIDPSGNLFVTDYYNNRIRKMTPDGVVTTLAGSTQGYADGIGSAAQLSQPRGIAIDSFGNLFVADTGNNRIRKITPAGVVTTFAGSTQGYADGIGTAAKFYVLRYLTIDSSNNLYVADAGNHRIRKITPAGVVTTLAGNGASTSIDGLGTSASFNSLWGITTDSAGNLYTTDYWSTTIRKITVCPAGKLNSTYLCHRKGF